MPNKILLKVFEYATAVKDKRHAKKIEEELLETMDEQAKQKELAKIKRKRQESFMLHSPSSQNANSDDELDPKALARIANTEDSEDEAFANEDSTKTKAVETQSKPLTNRSLSDLKRNFQLDDVLDFVNKGISDIIDDDVTKRFTTEGKIFFFKF